MAEQEETVSFKLVRRAENIGAAVVVIVFASVSLYLMLAGWGWFAVGVGVFCLVGTLATAFHFIDYARLQLVVTNEGMHLRTRFHEQNTIFPWNAIQRVTVGRYTNSLTIVSDLVIVRRQVGVSNCRLLRFLHEPEGPSLTISRNAPDLPALLELLKERVPHAFPP